MDRGNRKSHYFTITAMVAVVTLSVSQIYSGLNMGNFYLRQGESIIVDSSSQDDGLKPTKIRRQGPFDMPLEGPTYDIFQPFYDMNETKKDKPLIAPP